MGDRSQQEFKNMRLVRVLAMIGAIMGGYFVVPGAPASAAPLASETSEAAAVTSAPGESYMRHRGYRRYYAPRRMYYAPRRSFRRYYAPRRVYYAPRRSVRRYYAPRRAYYAPRRSFRRYYAPRRAYYAPRRSYYRHW